METKKIEGFYGGKFFPMHLGHLLCIDRMSKQCDHGVVILFIKTNYSLRQKRPNGTT